MFSGKQIAGADLEPSFGGKGFESEKAQSQLQLAKNEIINDISDISAQLLMFTWYHLIEIK